MRVARLGVEETLFRSSPVTAPIPPVEVVPIMPNPLSGLEMVKTENSVKFHEACVIDDAGAESRNVTSEPHSPPALCFHALVVADVCRILEIRREAVLLESLDAWGDQYASILLSFSQRHLWRSSLNVIRQLVMQVFNRSSDLHRDGSSLQRAQDAAMILGENSRPKVRIYLREHLQDLVGGDFCTNNSSLSSSQRSTVVHASISSSIISAEHSARSRPVNKNQAPAGARDLNGSLDSYANPDTSTWMLDLQIFDSSEEEATEAFSDEDEDKGQYEDEETRRDDLVASNLFPSPPLTPSLSKLLDLRNESAEEAVMYMDVLQKCTELECAEVEQQCRVGDDRESSLLDHSECLFAIGTPKWNAMPSLQSRAPVSRISTLARATPGKHRGEDGAIAVAMGCPFSNKLGPNGSFNQGQQSMTPRVLVVSPVISASPSPVHKPFVDGVKTSLPDSGFTSISGVLSLRRERTRQERDRREEEDLATIDREMERATCDRDDSLRMSPRYQVQNTGGRERRVDQTWTMAVHGHQNQETVMGEELSHNRGTQHPYDRQNDRQRWESHSSSVATSVPAARGWHCVGFAGEADTESSGDRRDVHTKTRYSSDAVCYDPKRHSESGWSSPYSQNNHNSRITSTPRRRVDHQGRADLCSMRELLRLSAQQRAKLRQLHDALSGGESR